MSDGIVLDTEDIKKILAKEYGVEEKDIIKSQYSWIIKMKKLGKDDCLNYPDAV